MITKAQVKKLFDTGKVVDVEDEGMDEGRFFVHLGAMYSWERPEFEQVRTKSFGNFSTALAAIKKIKKA